MLIWQQHKKLISVIVIGFSFLLFGDSLLHFIGHILHIIIEFVESILEHLLETAFGLTPKQAQIVLFYSFVIVMCYVSWQLAYKTYFALLAFYAEAKLYWRELKKSRRFKAALMLGALGSTVYLFS